MTFAEIQSYLLGKIEAHLAAGGKLRQGATGVRVVCAFGKDKYFYQPLPEGCCAIGCGAIGLRHQWPEDGMGYDAVEIALGLTNQQIVEITNGFDYTGGFDDMPRSAYFTIGSNLRKQFIDQIIF